MRALPASSTRSLFILLGAGLLAGCSFSSGGSGGSSPSKTYIVMPNGQAVPANRVNSPAVQSPQTAD